ncbi:alpha/beta hydrolase [Mumia sp. Pv 4-285]|uniref:alpha/beta hydrolase n=1 Tax=Mumia qirimensis TaxID=3234852 RepID=UPI00351CCD54
MFAPRRSLLYCALPGAYGALLLGCLAFTPSLLPRPAVFQGAVAGVTSALGYAVGVLAAYVWRELVERQAREPSRRSWTVFAGVATVAVTTSLALGWRWQHEVRALMGMDDEPLAWMLAIPFVWGLVTLLLVMLGRATVWVYRRLVRLLDRALGERAAKVIGLAVLVGLLVAAVDGVLFERLRAGADDVFSYRNLITPDGVERPLEPERSGSEASLVDWDTLGREGQVFAASGPRAAQISAYTGQVAREPVRVFAGLATAEDVAERAALAVDDLERAGGFARSRLLVTTTTGSGWVEPTSVAGFEYLGGGDTATIALQYSSFPSWISYLVDQEQARDAGRELFDAVYAHWSAMPAEARPELYVFGESLGSFGAEAAFSGAYDLANRTSGALFVGPPSFNPLWGRFVRDRETGTPEVLPQYADGARVRFARRASDPIPPRGQPWDGPRILYLQHASDPIVWWNQSLLLTRPDWLAEDRGPDVLGTVRWIPLVTFWQVTADMALGTKVPAGYGHVYAGEHVDAWATILRTPGWTPEESRRLRTLVANTD